MVSLASCVLLEILTFLQKIDVEVEYVTAAEPGITRTLHLARVVATTLPISVNVEDFFRGNRFVQVISVQAPLPDVLVLVSSPNLPSLPQATSMSAYQLLNYRFLRAGWTV